MACVLLEDPKPTWGSGQSAWQNHFTISPFYQAYLGFSGNCLGKPFNHATMQPSLPGVLGELLGEISAARGALVLGLCAPLVEAHQAEVVLARGLHIMRTHFMTHSRVLDLQSHRGKSAQQGGGLAGHA